VLTVSTFDSLDSIEDFLKNHSAFSPAQAVELLEEKTLTISEYDGVAETTNVFTIEEK
jgi:hypothetical protein